MKKAITGSIVLLASVYLLSAHQGQFKKYHETDELDIVMSTVNPPAARTGAPGEGNCTGCHNGTVQSAAGTIDVSFSGAGDEYVVGQTYTLTIGTATGAKNGFEATILDGSNVKAGSFTSGTNYSITTSAGRQYVRQNVADGITSWTINWTAPDTDKGDLTVYYAFNKSNNDDNDNGDVIYLGQFTIGSAIFNTITDHEKQDQQIRIWMNAETNSVHASFYQEESASVSLQLIDLSGRLIYHESLGNLNSGEHQLVRNLPVEIKSGTYVISLIIGNQVFDRKIVIS